jgi:hypothetical protein
VSQDDEVPGGSAPDEQPGSTWQDPDPADTSTTSWMERPTEQVRPDPDTVRLGDQPTSVDPLVPPAPPAPASPPTWSSPAPPAPAPPPAWGTAPPPPAPAALAWNSPAGAPPPPAPGAPGAPGAPTGPAWGQPQWSGQALPGVAGWGAVPQAPKPGVVPLRPLGLGEILDGAISYVRRDPRTVLGIAAVVAVVGGVIQALALILFGGGYFDLVTDPTATIDESEAIGSVVGFLAAFGVSGIVQFVLQLVATGMLTVVMSQAVLGRRVTTQDAWARIKPRFWPLVGLTILVSLVTGLIAGGGILLTVLLAVALSNVDGALAALVAVVLAIGTILVTVWVSVRLVLSPPALVLEKVGVIEAMRRSWALVKGGWWRTFGISLLAGILAVVVANVLSVPLSFVAGLLPALNPDLVVIGLALSSALTTIITTMVTLPFLAGVTSLLYIDRRIRREGLDLELQRAAAAGA